MASNQSFFITVFHQNDNFFIKSQNYEIANTLWESSYKEGVKLINQNADEIDAIIIDASLEGNVLDLLLSYEKENLLAKTIIIDNLKLETKINQCGRCSNNCEIVTVYRNDKLLDFWGNHCEKGSILKNV